jgi:hypothetical protein
MLGTLSEAQDAVQEAWLRLDRSDPAVSPRYERLALRALRIGQFLSLRSAAGRRPA